MKLIHARRQRALAMLVAAVAGSVTPRFGLAEIHERGEDF